MSRPSLSEQQKRELIKKYALKFNFKTFIETGTQKGLMVDYVKDVFDKIYTIEILERLYNDAVKRFENNKNINLFLGDSAIVLNQIMFDIDKTRPILFWLDAHNYTCSPALNGM